MKKMIILLLALFLNTAIMHARQELTICSYIDQANKAYNAGNYEDALEQYKKIKPQNAALWYAQAECYYALGDYPYAIASYIKVLLHGSYSLRKRVYDRMNALQNASDFFIFSSWGKVIILFFGVIPLFFMQLLFLFFLIIMCMLILCIYTQKIYKPFLLSMSLVCLFLVGSFLWAHYYIQTRKYAVIADEHAIFIGPCLDYHTLETVSSGAVVTIAGSEQGWYKIKVRGKIGWIPEQALVII